MLPRPRSRENCLTHITDNNRYQRKGFVLKVDYWRGSINCMLLKLAYELIYRYDTNIRLTWRDLEGGETGANDDNLKTQP